MNLWTSQKVTLALAGIGVVALFAAADSIALAGIGLVLICAGLAVQFKYWRCPSCGRYLGRKGFRQILHCPFCGEPL